MSEWTPKHTRAFFQRMHRQVNESGESLDLCQLSIYDVAVSSIVRTGQIPEPSDPRVRLYEKIIRKRHK